MPTEHCATLRQMSKFIQIFSKIHQLLELKKTNLFFRFKLAISDCTASLILDSKYVKTYQRRCAAYMALGMYKEAKNDLIEILKLEPNNKQAKLDTEVVDNKIKLVSK